MPAPAIIILGTGSNTGKSLITAGLCRAFTNRGLGVRPFKPQNMSNNAAVTDDGGEIGRAQALQAQACKIPASVHMNPVLLKPETETGAQIIVQGKKTTSCKARDYARLKPSLMPAVLDSFARISRNADLVIAEGAGSPAEVNLRDNDIANLGFAMAAGIPALIIGDIDRGGVIAALAGTHSLLRREEKSCIKGFIINKFRGDASLFDDALAIINRHTGWPAIGIAPWFEAASNLPAEDTLDLQNSTKKPGAILKIAVLQLPRIANFDDLDPLIAQNDISLAMIRPGKPLPGNADLVIIPGSKSVIHDMAAIRSNHWDGDIHAHIRRGGHVLGICGGYQMLGRYIHDPGGVEGISCSIKALGLLNVETTLSAQKTLTSVTAKHIASQLPVSGYEIHLGHTSGPGTARAFLSINGKNDGACSPDGRITGTYVHGLFGEDDFRRAFLSNINKEISGGTSYTRLVEITLDDLAAHLEAHLDLNVILTIAQSHSKTAMIKTSPA